MRWPTPRTGHDGDDITNTAPRPATTRTTAFGSHDQRSTTAVLGLCTTPVPSTSDAKPVTTSAACSHSATPSPSPGRLTECLFSGQQPPTRRPEKGSDPLWRAPEPTAAIRPPGPAPTDRMVLYAVNLDRAG